MQPCRLRCIGFNFAITSAISILCSRTDCNYFHGEHTPHSHGFNLMQSRRLRFVPLSRICVNRKFFNLMYVIILSLIFHCFLPSPCCCFAYFYYLTIHICNQPCIVFIYILYIFSTSTEKEPLPQLVEVLLHAAARAATILIVQPHGLCLRVLLLWLKVAVVSILCSHFNLSQSRGLLRQQPTTATFFT